MNCHPIFRLRFVPLVAIATAGLMSAAVPTVKALAVGGDFTLVAAPRTLAPPCGRGTVPARAVDEPPPAPSDPAAAAAAPRGFVVLSHQDAATMALRLCLRG